jgi:radical SAM protein with 4Fe4S-binding SPASM domain
MSIITVNECVTYLRNTHNIVSEIICNYSEIEQARLDLYIKLKMAHKTEYSPDQRIIFVLTQDLYNSNSTTGSVLQAIQVILQDIDISNFFVCIVTTNPDFDSEYEFIKNNISVDPVSFHVYKCTGDFDKIKSEHTSIQGKAQSLKDIDFDLITEQHRDLIFNDPVFCIIPWIGINVATTSKVYPCCDTKKEFSIGNVKDNSIHEIWNSDNIKAIRKSMLQGTPVESCQNCYKKEKLKRPSSRTNFNQEFAQNIHVIDNTNPDGSLPSTDIKFWDVRYNNLCNLSCRSCNPSDSSSWYQVHNAINPDKKLTVQLLEAGNNQDAVFDQMQKSIDQIDTIYFAGGEPAMIENFYKILELLIANNRTDVRLRYNLNMTRLTLKNRSLLNLWNKFKHVSIGASLDAEGDRAAYMRSGTVWKDIVINRNAIAENCPHVDFWVSATTGLINALHVPDFHQSWVEKGFVKPSDFNIQLLFAPAYQSIINAPAELKQKIIDRYTKHLAWLTSQDYHGRAVHGFNSVIEMCHQPGHYDSEKFWKEVNQLDKYHGTSLLQTFPELCNTGL